METYHTASADIKELAARIRMATLDAMASFGSGHVGGCMSIADTLAVLYGCIMHYDPKDPGWAGRDRLALSKGHCGPALYAALALSGFFPTEWLRTLNQPGTRLPSHCDRLKTPGIDVSTGSLGQGASLACGLAMAAKLQGKAHFVYAILGDGELQEGQVWEAFQFAAQQRLGRLIFLIDRNRFQLDGRVADISDLEPLEEKLSAFRLRVRQVNGHDVDEIERVLSEICSAPGENAHAVILNTRKGGGYCFAEQAAKCHYMAISETEAEIGKQEILRRLRETLPVEGYYD